VPGASLLAAVFLGQTPPAAAIAGLVVILAGMALVVVNNRTPRAARMVEAPVD
jgi:drug/metabolite transporter (DMT)-like permease